MLSCVRRRGAGECRNFFSLDESRRIGLHGALRRSVIADVGMSRGLATAAAQKQHLLAAIMKQTRHKSADMALFYAADTELWVSVSDGLFA